MSIQNPNDQADFEGLKPSASFSSISLHRKCPQAWYFRYGMRLERLRDTSAPPMILGSWWSVLRAAESLTRGRKAESLLFVPRDMKDERLGIDFDPKTVTIKDVVLAADVSWKSYPAEDKEAFIEKMNGTLPERLMEMYRLWHTANVHRVETELPLGAEVFWKRALPRPEIDRAWSLLQSPDKLPQMHLLGYVDEIFIDRERDGMVVIRDHKAPMDLSNATTSFDDLMDSQLQLYPWGMAPLLKRHGVDMPRAVEFDRTRSVGASSPALTATSGTLSKATTSYDLATYRRWAAQDTRPSDNERQNALDVLMEAGKLSEEAAAEALVDLEEMGPGQFWGKFGEYFASGPRKGQPKFGVYEEDPAVIAKLSDPVEVQKWTKRSRDPVSARMVQTHLRAAVDTAADIAMTQVRAGEYGEAARNLDRRGCQMCDFAALCRAQMVGGVGGEYDLEAMGLREKKKKDGETANG